jgi:peptide/nickel transport system substrate-binding protein
MVAIMMLAGCSKRARRTPDDTLVVLIEGKLDNIDPRFASTNNDVKFSRLVMPGLTSIDRMSLEPRPELAASVTQVDDVTWDVLLRDDLRFSDGTPLTAADVVYSYQSVLDPAINSLHRGSFAERIRRVEATGPLGARFHLVEPLATFLADLDFGIFSAAADRRGQILGAGAYQVVSFDPDRLLLERNPYYHDQPGEMPRIEARSVRDANARAIMLVGGSGDMSQNALRHDLVDAVAGRARVYVDSGPGVILTYLMMQNEDPLLADVRVRQAIAHAIDRERIIAVKFGGRAVLATGFLPPAHWAYEPDVAAYPYDPERAARLLDEAGFPDPDGPGGQPRMRLGYKTSADQFRLAIARVIAAELGQVGIEVEVRAYEFGTFFTDIKKGNYQIATMQSAPITDPDYYYTYFHSERVPDPVSFFGHNRWRYRNQRVDELVEQGRRVADRQARLSIYAEVQKILARELPVIALWHEDNVAILNVDVQGYEILPSARFAGLRKARKRARD